MKYEVEMHYVASPEAMQSRLDEYTKAFESGCARIVSIVPAHGFGGYYYFVIAID